MNMMMIPTMSRFIPLFSVLFGLHVPFVRCNVIGGTGSDQSPTSSNEVKHQECSNCEDWRQVGCRTQLFYPDDFLLSSNIDSGPPALSEDELKTLRQVFIVHRHGDRTPINFPPKDELQHEPFWMFHGLGQLTNRGKARTYLLGKIMRNRYNDFLERSVNKQQRISRSSGSLRCIESAQAFLSSFLSLRSNNNHDGRNLHWDSEDNILAGLWQPASIMSVPAKCDGMLAESSQCDNLMAEYRVINDSPLVKQIFKDYAKEAEIIKTSMGFPMDQFYYWFWVNSLLEIEIDYFREKVPSEILEAAGRIREAAILSMQAYQSTVRSRRLRSGLLISDIVTNMKKNSSVDTNLANRGEIVHKFFQYSAHDLTLVSLLGTLDEYHNIIPDYASTVVFELHEEGGDKYVKTFFLAHVPGELTELHIKKCEEGNPDGRCTLKAFEQLVRPYMIDDWQSWMNECGNDLTEINPYAPTS